MRLLQLLFLTLLCTCARAQMVVDKVKELNTSFVSGASSNFVAYLPDGKVAALGKDRDDKAYEIHVYESLTDLPKERAVTVDKKETPLFLAGTVEGGFLTGWSSKKSGARLIWHENDTGIQLDDVLLTREEIFSIWSEREPGGLQSVLFTTSEGSYVARYRLERKDETGKDTVSAPPRFLVTTPPTLITAERFIDYCRLQGGDYLGMSRNTGTGITLTRFTSGGTLVGEPLRYDPRIKNPKSVRFLPQSGQYLVAGEIDDRLALIKIDPLGTLSSGNPQSNKVIDGGVAVSQFKLTGLVVLPDDQLVSVGTYLTSNVNNTSPRLWEAVFGSSTGSSFPKPSVHTQASDSYSISQLLTTYDRQVIALGLQQKVKAITLIGAKVRTEAKSTSPAIAYAFSNPVLHDHQGDQVLDASEQAALELPFVGTGGRGHFRARLILEKTSPGLNVTPQVYSRTLLGSDTGSLYFPLFGTEVLPTGAIPYTIEVDHQGSVISRIKDTLFTRSKPAPLIDFDTTSSELTYLAGKQTGTFDRQDTLQIKVVIRNRGRDSARNIILSTLYIPDVYISEYQVNLGNLAPGEVVARTISVAVPSHYEHTQLALNFFGRDDHPRYIHTSMSWSLPDVYAIRGDDGQIQPNPIPDEYRRQQRGGPSVPEVPFFMESIKCTVPSATEGYILRTTQYHVPIRAHFFYRGPLDSDRVVITANGKEIDLCFRQLKEVGEKYSVGIRRFEFLAELSVEEGTTEYVISVDGTQIESESFWVEFQKKYENHLHVYVIGIPYKDSTITEQTARAVADAYEANKERRYFDRVIVHPILNDSTNTSSASISQLITEMQQRHQPNRQGKLHIMPYCIVYLTGHGNEGPNGDVLIDERERRTSFSLLEKVISPLVCIPAQKLFIVDACFSSKAAVGFETLMKSQVIDSSFATRLITSSNSASIVRDNRHSFFSQALLRVLQHTSDVSSIPAYLKDGMYTSSEIFGILCASAKGIRTINYSPKYASSANSGHPSFQDYFYELKLAKNCTIRQ